MATPACSRLPGTSGNSSAAQVARQASVAHIVQAQQQAQGAFDTALAKLAGVRQESCRTPSQRRP